MIEPRLELLGESHLAGIAALVDDAEMLRFTRVPEPVPNGFAAWWLRRYEEGRRAGSREGFAVVDAADGSFLGLALMASYDREARTAELGYAVVPAARGRGVATAALRRLSDWALDELGAERLELFISPANEASKRVAERCGYTLEGVLRSRYFKQGRREDTELWSRLPGDLE